MLNLTQDEIRQCMTQLDQALYAHNQWFESLIRTLICHLPYDRRDVNKDSYRGCVFGQWLYSNATDKLRDHAGYKALESDHKLMHQLAAEILQLKEVDQNVPLFEFERFNNALDSMRLQLHTLKRELEDQVYNRDPLTRAYSRIGMLTKLREMHELAKRGIESCAIAMMDLDDFKIVNDKYGHQAGDQVLSSTASYIMDHLRPFDKIYRFGGEEFLITILHMDIDNSLGTLERLRQGISENIVPFNSHDIRITASFGLSLLDPDIPVEQSIDRTDKALYAAKAAGRNCVKIWDPSL